MLESAQAGLSWLTILKKRENYRQAYENFNPQKIAKYQEKKIKSLLNNAGIIRNRRKIEASINNARRIEELLSLMRKTENTDLAKEDSV